MFYIKETSKRLSISRYLLHLKARQNLNTMSKIKAITIQYKLIEMSETRARGACTQRDIKKHTYPNGNKTAFDCTRFGM